jgi:putative SOS response-associated peptidase YedK
VALVTTEANPLMRQIHNSKNLMPTMLPDELAWEWMMQDLVRNESQNLQPIRSTLLKWKHIQIEKDFRTTGTPTKAFVYADVPELTYQV